MTRAPDKDEEQPRKGGGAAERLRQHMAERFGDEAPPIPPDEDERGEEASAPSEADERRDEAIQPTNEGEQPEDRTRP